MRKYWIGVDIEAWVKDDNWLVVKRKLRDGTTIVEALQPATHPDDEEVPNDTETGC